MYHYIKQKKMEQEPIQETECVTSLGEGMQHVAVRGFWPILG
jgi:hypothetical protein